MKSFEFFHTFNFRCHNKMMLIKRLTSTFNNILTYLEWSIRFFNQTVWVSELSITALWMTSNIRIMNVFSFSKGHWDSWKKKLTRTFQVFFFIYMEMLGTIINHSFFFSMVISKTWEYAPSMKTSWVKRSLFSQTFHHLKFC